MENQERVQNSSSKWADKWKDKVRIWKGRPTPRQLSTWEIDGGYHEASDQYILINGRLCSGFFAKIFAYFSGYFKKVERDIFAKLTFFKVRDKRLQPSQMQR